MHSLVGLVTGHVALNRHLKLVGVKDSPLCSEEEETALHFFGQCPTLVIIWQCVLGMHSFTALELGKVRFSNVIRFAHSSERFTTHRGAFGMRIGPNQSGLSAGQGPPQRKDER